MFSLYEKIFYITMSVPQNTVMDLNKVMTGGACKVSIMLGQRKNPI